MLRHWCIKTPPCFLFIFSLVFGVSPLFSAPPPSEGVDGPVSIISEKMTLKNLEDRIVFEGAVLIKRGDVTINADFAEVLLSKSGQSPSLLSETDNGREITEIITHGNVRIVRGSQRAKADKGVYKKGDDVIILTGNPEVWDADFHVKGKTITFFMKEERTLVANSQAVIYDGAKGLSGKK